MIANIDFNSVSVKYDSNSDVLYAKMKDTTIVESRTVDGDDFVVLNMDKEKKVVGVQLINTDVMSGERWRTHFTEERIPAELFAAINSWLHGGNYDSRL